MENPYQAPETESQSDAEEEAQELASLGERLAASILDITLMMIIVLPLILVPEYLNGTLLDDSSFLDEVITGLIGFAVFVIMNGWFLYKSGQSIGKKILKIKIVHHQTGELISFSRLLFLRQFIFDVVLQLHPIGMGLSLLDVLFIFRPDRRCLHDWVAGTKVVKVRRYD